MANSNFRRPLVDEYDDHREADTRDQRASQDSDPLAELARLIGQTDPLATFGRGQPQAAPRETQLDPYADQHAAPAADDVEDAPPQPPSWLQSSPGWRNEQAALPAADDRFYAGEQRAFAQDERYAETNPQVAEGYAPGAEQRYDDALYGQAPERAPQDSGPPYAYPGHEQGYDDQYAAPQDEAPSRRRGGLLTVAIVAMLAVVGTAGAFAYRSFSGSAKSGEPPVIRADATPTKVVPPTPSKDPSGKIITDRIGGQAGERVVSREEAPVEVKGAGPRVVFPPLTQQGAPQPPITQVPAMSGGGGMSDEPKRIRTVSVRPDQPDVRAPAPAAQTRPASAPAAGNAPIQLTPSRAAPDTRPVASVPPPATSAPAASGGYVVQVSSQKTEADAASSYRALQAKFPGVLASRQPLIKRADLSAQGKGIVYRAVVGPFASSEDASQMCSNLKVAGGQCVVQRN